jgi:hypothetical protein
MSLNSHEKINIPSRPSTVLILPLRLAFVCAYLVVIALFCAFITGWALHNVIFADSWKAIYLDFSSLSGILGDVCSALVEQAFTTPASRVGTRPLV